MSRTCLPAPMIDRSEVSIWSILKNCIGKELSKITMPVCFNEPITMLQRASEYVEFTQWLHLANSEQDPVARMELVCTFIIAGLSANCHRIVKPFNPLLYETYEYNHELPDGSLVKSLAQQVSHHPPITAVHCESETFCYEGSVNPKIKFWGRSIEIQPDGQCRIHLKRFNETYVFKSVACSIHNIIVGKLWFEHSGPLDIRCAESKIQAKLEFKQAGWFSNDVHKFSGIISEFDEKFNEKKKLKFVYGKWSDYIKSVDYIDYENFLKENTQLKSFQIPKSKILWKLDTQYLAEYYNFTAFTLKLNELTPELEKSIAKTDSRFRLDVRKLEEGDLDGAANEKHRLEEKQRSARSRDQRFKDPSPDFLWFDLKSVPNSKEKYWTYKGGFWESKCNPETFPDLF